MTYLVRRPEPAFQYEMADAEPVALLFDDGVLHHATTPALQRFSLLPGAHLWDDLREALKDSFPDFPTCPGPGEHGALTLQAKTANDPQEIEISWWGSLCWVTCLDHQYRDRDHASASAAQRACDASPHPIWQTDRDGTVIWRNNRYLTLFEQLHGRRPQSDECLFEQAMTARNGRTSLTSRNGGDPDWFEISTREVNGVTVHHATCISGLVKAEDSLRTFVQTLTKTFAHLRIGLAIFNREDQLVLFNPALLELSGVPAEFLSARPNMLSFFDQLRENRRMPEPKNYGSWRQQIADLASAAADGRYRETWSLEDGRTYAVQGRPHPEGATVFLFEDISAEVSLTRNFRAELELSQYLLDKVEDCLVVFSPSGVLTFCNSAYRDLWQQNPDAAFADITVSDCLDVWRSKAKADVPWRDFLKVSCGYSNRQSLTTRVTMDNGQLMTCVAETIASGATLICFKTLEEVAAEAH
ncbi:PAS-domain containing protein [Sulfitobacter sp. EhC04]|uniref:PAS-domain containing protein n=1 Tax=Sulfitobacter sp. EhC04 TaxID=1849168 RepID=UPI0010FD92EE|nr:PAS-domain containing protein [Sulfitobacter sp. EhC04]